MKTIITLLVLFLSLSCSTKSPTEPEKEFVIVEKCYDTYIRTIIHRAFWSADYDRVYTIDDYTNLANSIDNLENVGVAFVDIDIGEVYYIAQGGFFEVYDNSGYVFDEVLQAESGQSLWIYSYMPSDSIPESVKDITWINLEWSKNVPFDSVVVAVNRNYDKLEKKFVEKKIELWKDRINE